MNKTIWRVADEKGLACKIAMPGYKENILGPDTPGLERLKMKEGNKWPAIAFAKLLVPWHCEDDFAIYVDCDMEPAAAEPDLSPLLGMNFSEPLAMCPQADVDIDSVPFPFNTGLVVFNCNEWRKLLVPEKIIDAANELMAKAPKNISVGDEDVIDKLQIPWHRLDLKWNCRFQMWQEDQVFWHKQGMMRRA